MPYIKQEDRDWLDMSINTVIARLHTVSLDVLTRPGPTNYAITRIVAGALKPEGGWSYHSISRAIAVLRDAATEMERRLMGPREDVVIKENGDVPEYEKMA